MEQGLATFSTIQAAAYLGIHPETLRRWAEASRVRHTITPTGRLRFTKPDLDNALNVVEVKQPA